MTRKPDRTTTTPWWHRLWAVAAVAVALTGWPAAPAHAAPNPKPGVLVTRDVPAQEWAGEIDEEGVPGDVIVRPFNGRPAFQLSRRNVASVTYFATVQDEFAARQRAAAAGGVPTWVALGRWALAKDQLPMAEQALASAQRLDAKSPDVAALAREVDAKRPKAVAPPTQPAQPAQPQVAPAPATQPPAAAPAKPKLGPPTRLLTAEEMQKVRIRELKRNEPPLKIQIPNDARKKVVDAGLLSAPQAKAMQNPELAMFLIEKGGDLASLAKVQSDPAGILEYRTKINKALLTGCAAAACHGGPQGGNLILFGQPEKEDTVLTNFVTLQKIEKDTKGVRSLMVDRLHPEQSLLLNYLLPLGTAQTPHPKVDGFRPLAVRGADDPVYQTMKTWMAQTLKVLPDETPRVYDDIDLTAPAPDPKKPAAAPAAGPAAKP
ncbi:MAG TPA: hypothetical protein VF796_23045 [Humisphaera sp.]